MQMEVLFLLTPTFFSFKIYFPSGRQLNFSTTKGQQQNRNWENWLHGALWNAFFMQSPNDRNKTFVVLPNSYSEGEYLPVLIKSGGPQIIGTTYKFIISSLSHLFCTADSLAHYLQRIFENVEPLLWLQVEST